ncbi:hypothetical protein [Kribbella deserti]|uniref:Uncharacterized protein n=1 Tax=Kribbella deserti TaxID=1926257 RepID=A0ABV6QTM9_9ACTN
MLRVGLPAVILAVALAWFAYASYRRAQLAEAEIAALKDEVHKLENVVGIAEQGLRTLASHPSVPPDVAVTADITLADLRRRLGRTELDG